MIISDKDINLDEYLAAIGLEEAQEISPAENYWHQLVARATNGIEMQGPRLPWVKTFDTIRFPPGKLSVWAGINGHGKSQLLGQCVMWWLKDQTALIASLEMKPVETLWRMSSQWLGRAPQVDDIDGFCKALQGRLWIYDQTDSVATERILGLVHFAANELRVDHLVIDSLTKCGLNRERYDLQAQFVDKLQWAAKRHDIHIHLVCHMRKGESETSKPGKFDIRGAAEVTDLADNVITVWRNKPKESAIRKRRSGIMLNASEESELRRPDSIMTVEKNREWGLEESFGLWFHQSAQQFLAMDTPHAMIWDSEVEA